MRKKQKQRKEKKELIVFFLHSLLIPLNFAFYQKIRKSEYIVNLCLSKKKKQIKERKTSKKKPVDFASADSWLQKRKEKKKTVFWTPSVPSASVPPLTVEPWLASLVTLHDSKITQPVSNARGRLPVTVKLSAAVESLNPVWLWGEEAASLKEKQDFPSCLMLWCPDQTESKKPRGKKKEKE